MRSGQRETFEHQFNRRLVKVLYGIATDSPVEAEPERPLEKLLAIGLGALVAKQRMGDNQSPTAPVEGG